MVSWKSSLRNEDEFVPVNHKNSQAAVVLLTFANFDEVRAVELVINNSINLELLCQLNRSFLNKSPEDKLVN